MQELNGRGFVLRAYREGDADSLARVANNRNVWRNLGHGHAFGARNPEDAVLDLGPAGPIGDVRGAERQEDAGS